MHLKSTVVNKDKIRVMVRLQFKHLNGKETDDCILIVVAGQKMVLL